MCVKNNTNIYVARASNSKRDCDAWSLLLLAATVQSFAHMPLRISVRNIIINNSCPYVARKSFSLAKSVLKPCMDSSTRNSWRNHWLWLKCKNCHCAIPRGTTRQLHHPKFSKTCLVVGTTTSYNHIPPLKVSTGCVPVCSNSWIIERNTFSQFLWCTLLRDSIQWWKDWSYQWFPVTLTSSTDRMCSLSWQGTHDSRQTLGHLFYNHTGIDTPLPITFQNTLWRGWNAKLCP